jgi:DNA-binding beta-propeller fold protein YncE
LKNGGFDHAAVHEKSGTLYVAHTANNAVDIIDCERDRYLRSIQGLTRVAGVLVSNDQDIVFTSNRGEKTVSIFRHDKEDGRVKVPVGGFPNGLAYDPSMGLLLAANVSKLDDPNPVTISTVEVNNHAMISDIPVPGRTRWTVYDRESDRFYVNISNPSQIIATSPHNPKRITSIYDIPATGPHGLDLDSVNRRLFCACDQGGLFVIDLHLNAVSKASDLAGQPDVIFHNGHLNHLYVAIGDPGLIQVFDTKTMTLLQTVMTESGTHTIGFSQTRNKVYAFMPSTHRAAVYFDSAV